MRRSSVVIIAGAFYVTWNCLLVVNDSRKGAGLSRGPHVFYLILRSKRMLVATSAIYIYVLTNIKENMYAKTASPLQMVLF